ncbi:MAG: hypothetical protein AABY22_03205 [Nanoarchaeota archaeon]
MTNREKIMSFFNISDLENPITANSIAHKMEQADEEDEQERINKINKDFQIAENEDKSKEEVISNTDENLENWTNEDDEIRSLNIKEAF